MSGSGSGSRRRNGGEVRVRHLLNRAGSAQSVLCFPQAPTELGHVGLGDMGADRAVPSQSGVRSKIKVLACWFFPRPILPCGGVFTLCAYTAFHGVYALPSLFSVDTGHLD